MVKSYLPVYRLYIKNTPSRLEIISGSFWRFKSYFSKFFGFYNVGSLNTSYSPTKTTTLLVFHSLVFYDGQMRRLLGGAEKWAVLCLQCFRGIRRISGWCAHVLPPPPARFTPSPTLRTFYSPPPGTFHPLPHPAHVSPPPPPCARFTPPPPCARFIPPHPAHVSPPPHLVHVSHPPPPCARFT